MATRLSGVDKLEERRRRVASGDTTAPADSGYGIQGRAIPIVEVKLRPPAATSAPTSRERVNSLGEALWRLFCSVRLAMALIALISIATLVGTLLIQMPPELQGDPASRTMWVNGLTPRFGDFTGLMYDLGLFNLFTSWWFKLLLLILTLNIVVCTLNRFPKMWKQSTRTRMEVGPRFFTHGEYTATLALPVETGAAQQQLAGALKRRGLSVRLSKAVDATDAQPPAAKSFAVYADRFRYMPLGTYLNHVGIVLIFIGAIWGTLLGSNIKIVDFAIPEGGDRAVGFDTGLVVHSDGFTEVDYPDGRAADYYSDIVLYENGQQVAQQRIRVNEPLEYKGILFHQAFFGNAADIKVTDDASGQVVYQGSVPLAYRSKMYGPDNPMGSFSLANGEIQVDVVAPAGPGDPTLRPGQLGLAVYRVPDDHELWRDTLSQRGSVSKQGLTFTFLRERQFSGLQVVRDHGVTIIFIATACMLAGIALVFYFPARRLWARVEPGDGGAIIHLKGQAPRRAGLAHDIMRLTDQLKAAGATIREESPAILEQREMFAEMGG
jgi:cytochrome c biogenesis protein